jgi:hypothetical protein
LRFTAIHATISAILVIKPSKPASAGFLMPKIQTRPPRRVFCAWRFYGVVFENERNLPKNWRVTLDNQTHGGSWRVSEIDQIRPPRYRLDGIRGYGMDGATPAGTG